MSANDNNTTENGTSAAAAANGSTTADDEETRDYRYKQLIERHLGKNGIPILVFHTFLLVFSLLLIMFLNISFIKNCRGGGSSLKITSQLATKPAIMSI